MMKRIHRTLIKADHKLGENEYVRGRVSALLGVFAYGVDNVNKWRFANVHCHDGWVIVDECTKRRYKKAAKYIEQMYPGLCVFDYQKQRGSK